MIIIKGDKININRPLFILAGNGPYENRGCEAIVRGTVKILRKFYTNPEFICVSNFQTKGQYTRQSYNESDASILHKRINFGNGVSSPDWWLDSINDLFFPEKKKYRIYREMLPYINNSDAVLSIGGDNYSLDYGIPSRFTTLDDLVLLHQKPLIIWGASVGPFSSIPDYEKYMTNHLKSISGIFARESTTVDYLQGIGVNSNVYRVADPAFLLDPIKPPYNMDELAIEKEAIGLNLSPLLARIVTGGDIEQWARLSALIVTGLAQETEMPIYLIPHVTSPHDNDYSLLQRVVSLSQIKKDNIILVGSQYSAAETKWIISKMAIFAGARTHSTIAALSSYVPTLSFAYSIKARGINQDIFGHSEYCLDSDDLNVNSVIGRIKSMIECRSEINKDLHKRIPEIQHSALQAGFTLKQIVEDNNGY